MYNSQVDQQRLGKQSPGAKQNRHKGKGKRESKGKSVEWSEQMYSAVFTVVYIYISHVQQPGGMKASVKTTSRR